MPLTLPSNTTLNSAMLLDYKLRNALLLTVLFHCVFSVPITDGLSEKMMKEPVAVTVKKSEEIRHHSKYLY